MRFAASLFALFAHAACTPPPRMTVPRSEAGVAIGTITLRLSNVHVLVGEHPVLVDTGSPGEHDKLVEGLHRLGIHLDDIRCAVVTHGHADHAGNARWLQQRGITIIAGQGDLWREIAGVHGHLKSTSFFATLLKAIIPGHYPPLWPDVRIHTNGRYDLASCGVAGEVIATPGHTQGSLVVLVGGGKVALVGDLFRGGALAGYVHPHEPKEHFYQDDLVLAHRRIHELLARGVEIFVLGHGGPARAADVRRVFGP
ncbi:MAG: MBL fold metallo-hydrolase [Deltaproteobacteria bacterium]|nr:MBL fold metallo-hydrolase [Deltaproteobacteria bacterium]